MSTATPTQTRLSQLVASPTEPAALVPHVVTTPAPVPAPTPSPAAAPPVDSAPAGKVVVFENVVEHSPEIGEFIAALAQAQGEFTTIERTLTATVDSKRTGHTYTYDYAPLDVVFDAVRPALSAARIAYMQFPAAAPNRVTVVTFLAHASGQWFRSRLAVGGPEHGDPQAVKSAVTYAKRIAFESILGISPAHDDDGDAAQRAVRGNGSSVRPGGPVQMPQRQEASPPRPAAAAPAPSGPSRTAPPPAPGPQTPAGGFTIAAFERKRRANGNGDCVHVQFSNGQIGSSVRPEMMRALEDGYKRGVRYEDVVLTQRGQFTYVEELIPLTSGGGSW